MLKWLLHRRLRAFQRANGDDSSHMHEVLDTDLGAFFKFARAAGALAGYRKDVPLDVYVGAGLTSSVQADCGPCTQIGVGFALRAGVPPATVVAVVQGDLAAMSPEVALGVRFARAVLARDAAAEACRDEILRRWGPRAVLTLSFGIMAAQLYPTFKYALGHGRACTRIVVAGQTVSPRRLAAEAA
jgi:hypothetical protein